MSKTSDEEELVWDAQQELILKKWSEVSSSYRYLHNAAYQGFVEMHKKFSLPTIILSTIAGTANFAIQSFPAEWRETVSLLVGTINLASGLIVTISQFYKIPELMEAHRVSSIEFGKLGRNISVELSLPYQQRSMSGFDYIAKCRRELDQLMEKSPDVPRKLVQRFGSRFQDSNFIKPDILEILPVQIYRNDEEILIKQKQELEEMKRAAQEEVRVQIQSAAGEVAKNRHRMKKKRMSATNIAESMSRLISSIEGTDTGLPPPPLDDNHTDTQSDDSHMTVCSSVDEEEEEKKDDDEEEVKVVTNVLNI